MPNVFCRFRDPGNKPLQGFSGVGLVRGQHGNRMPNFLFTGKCLGLHGMQKGVVGIETAQLLHQPVITASLTMGEPFR